MDKFTVNNQIVLMRKLVRRTKRHALQKLVHTIKIYQTKKFPGSKDEKIAKAIQNRKEELEALKKINIDNVSKKLLLGSARNHKIDTKNCSPEDRVLLRIAEDKEIKNSIEKFKQENPNCDLWLPELIELWDKKNDLRRNKNRNKKEKRLSTDQNQINNKKNYSKLIEVDNKNKQENQSKKEVAKPKKKNPEVVIKKIKLDEMASDEIIPDSNEPKNSEEQFEKNDKDDEDLNSDAFFISSDHKTPIPRENQMKSDKLNTKQSPFAQRTPKQRTSKRFNTPKARNSANKFQQRKQENREDLMKQNKSKTKGEKTSESHNEDKLHPSWEAKRKIKDKQIVKIDINTSKNKIKFSD